MTDASTNTGTISTNTDKISTIHVRLAKSWRLFGAAAMEYLLIYMRTTNLNEASINICPRYG